MWTGLCQHTGVFSQVYSLYPPSPSRPIHHDHHKHDIGTLTTEKLDLPASASSASSQSGQGHSDEVTESLDPGVDPEEDSSHYMAILIESLSILGRVQDALHVRA